MKVKNKMKGFYKDFTLARAKFVRNNGATLQDLISFLCSKGFHRQAATRTAEALMAEKA